MKVHWGALQLVDVTVNAQELAAYGVTAEELSLADGGGQRLLRDVFGCVEQLCGLRRDGRYTVVRCRPRRSGDCVLSVEFLDAPCPRGYIFDSADDLLDAINQLGGCEDFRLSDTEISRCGDQFSMFFFRTDGLSAQVLSLLSEYAAG